MTLHFKVKLLALRLLSNHYRNNVDGQSPSEFFSQFKLLPTEMMDAAQQAFPYYRREQLEEIFLGLINLGREHLPFDQLYSFITEKQFRRSIESITSNVLMHFVPGNFVEKVLLNGCLAPTLIQHREYEPSHFGCAANGKNEKVAFTRTVRQKWDKSNDILSEAKSRLDPNVQIELPFVSCFTEIPVEAIEFHAEHYGAFGLAFKKSRLLDEERFQIIRPVAYLDACESSVIPLLIAAIEDNWDHPGKRIRLLRDLFLTKPHNKLGFYPENAFSTYYEREWRYVSHLSWFRFEPTDIEFITVPSQSLTSLGYNALKEGGSVNQAAWTDGHPYKGHEKWVGYKVLEVAEQLKLKVMPIPILK